MIHIFVLYNINPYDCTNRLNRCNAHEKVSSFRLVTPTYIHIYKRTKHRYPEARQIHLDTCMLVDSVRITMS